MLIQNIPMDVTTQETTTITSGCVSDWGSTAETRVAADSTTGLGDGRGGRGGRETTQ